MTTKRKLTAGVVAASVFATGAFATTAFASSGWAERPDLTDEQKSALEEAHELRMSGEFDEADAVLEEAGIDRGPKGPREGRGERDGIVRDAVEANDYDAYLTAITDTPKADEALSEADFAKLVEAHALREAGDYEGSRAIMDELGIGGPQGKGHGGRGGHGGFGMGDCNM
jgi:hypothetical protein